MTEDKVDLHCPACGHEVFTVLEDGFHCARCGQTAQPYCELREKTMTTSPSSKGPH
jgi:DNA-directed RNA polymerase subunit RPC12/RpoP